MRFSLSLHLGERPSANKKESTEREVKADRPLTSSLHSLPQEYLPEEGGGMGAYSYAIKCRLPCQAADGSPAAY